MRWAPVRNEVLLVSRLVFKVAMRRVMVPSSRCKAQPTDRWPKEGSLIRTPNVVCMVAETPVCVTFALDATMFSCKDIDKVLDRRNRRTSTVFTGNTVFPCSGSSRLGSYATGKSLCNGKDLWTTLSVFTSKG